MNNKKSVNRLGQHDYFRLATWLQTNIDTFPIGCTYAQGAEIAGRALQRDISEWSFRDCLINLELKLPQRKEQSQDDKIKVLVSYVKHLWKEVHPTLDIPEDLRDM